MSQEIGRTMKELAPYLLKVRKDLTKPIRGTRICELFERVLGYDPPHYETREVQHLKRRLLQTKNLNDNQVQPLCLHVLPRNPVSERQQK
jgi:hypothetical protein